jgi:hypothetical protein
LTKLFKGDIINTELKKEVFMGRSVIKGQFGPGPRVGGPVHVSTVMDEVLLSMGIPQDAIDDFRRRKEAAKIIPLKQGELFN